MFELTNFETYEQLKKFEQQVLYNNLVFLVEDALGMFNPISKEEIWEWAEQNISLDSSSPYPGQFSIKNSPHLKRAFEAFKDPIVRRIIIKGSSQIAKTLFYLICWAWTVMNDPGGFIIGHPTDREAKHFTKIKLEPFIEENIWLKNIIHNKKRGKQNEASSTTYLKMHRGGWLEIITLGSKGSTRQRSAKRVGSDDINGIKKTKESEGSHVKNLEARTKTFKYTNKIIHCSTPTVVGSSEIDLLYEEGTQEEFGVTCNHCGAEQVFEDSQLHYEPIKDFSGKEIDFIRKTERIACNNCGYLYNESERIKLLQELGHYIAKYPERRTTVSLFINQMSSTLSNLESIIKDKTSAERAKEKGDFSDEESYFNNVLGLSYNRNKGKVIEDAKLLGRILREDLAIKTYKNDKDEVTVYVPNGVLLVTVGVDVQKGSKEKDPRLELLAVGWGRDEESWIVLDHTIICDVNNKKIVKEKLDEFREKTTFIREDGIVLPIKRMLIDSGWKAGKIIHENVIYEYTAGRQDEGIYSIKGSNNLKEDVIKNRVSIVNNGRTLLLILGTQKIKEIIYNRLEKEEPGIGYIHLTKTFCNEEFVKQLNSNKAVESYSSGVKVIVYQPKHNDVAEEALDKFGYAYAGMKHCIANWDRLEETINEIKKIKAEGKDKLNQQKKKINKPVRKRKVVRRA